MFETKVESSKSGGKVKRIFVPETMAFFKRYIDDFKIKGAWFNRCDSSAQNYESYSSSIQLAGLRAGLWRYKTAKQGQTLPQGEHLAPDGRVYRLKASSNNQKGHSRPTQTMAYGR